MLSAICEHWKSGSWRTLCTLSPRIVNDNIDIDCVKKKALGLGMVIIHPWSLDLVILIPHAIFCIDKGMGENLIKYGCKGHTVFKINFF